MILIIKPDLPSEKETHSYVHLILGAQLKRSFLDFKLMYIISDEVNYVDYDNLQEILKNNIIDNVYAKSFLEPEELKLLIDYSNITKNKQRLEGDLEAIRQTLTNLFSNLDSETEELYRLFVFRLNEIKNEVWDRLKISIQSNLEKYVLQNKIITKDVAQEILKNFDLEKEMIYELEYQNFPFQASKYEVNENDVDLFFAKEFKKFTKKLAWTYGEKDHQNRKDEPQGSYILWYLNKASIKTVFLNTLNRSYPELGKINNSVYEENEKGNDDIENDFVDQNSGDTTLTNGKFEEEFEHLNSFDSMEVEINLIENKTVKEDLLKILRFWRENPNVKNNELTISDLAKIIGVARQTWYAR